MNAKDINMRDVQELKEAICDVGRRIYQRGFAAANDGNITARLNENEILCTPTMCCKGFLTPGDICLVDLAGNQLAGRKRRSSEVLLHLEIMRARPDVQSVVHCHPPHATAFAITREPIPQAVLPEVELFLGEVPIAPYATPGTKKFAESVLPFVANSNVILLANHGTVSYGESVERAYWWTEILDSYCRVLILSRQLGPIHHFSRDETQELIELKKQWGFTDPRHAADFHGDIRGNATFRHTWPAADIAPRAFPPPTD
jgi:L-fuculose-phosphate aldolase